MYYLYPIITKPSSLTRRDLRILASQIPDPQVLRKLLAQPGRVAPGMPAVAGGDLESNAGTPAAPSAECDSLSLTRPVPRTPDTASAISLFLQTYSPANDRDRLPRPEGGTATNDRDRLPRPEGGTATNDRDRLPRPEGGSATNDRVRLPRPEEGTATNDPLNNWGSRFSESRVRKAHALPANDRDCGPRPEVRSEANATLRTLLANRRYTEAIERITAENLKNPEKSIYFADKLRFIQKLQSLTKKIEN